MVRVLGQPCEESKAVTPAIVGSEHVAAYTACYRRYSRERKIAEGIDVNTFSIILFVRGRIYVTIYTCVRSSSYT